MRPHAVDAAVHPHAALEAMPTLEVLTLQSPIWGGEGGFGFLNPADPTRRLG